MFLLLVERQRLRAGDSPADIFETVQEVVVPLLGLRELVLTSPELVLEPIDLRGVISFADDFSRERLCLRGNCDVLMSVVVELPF